MADAIREFYHLLEARIEASAARTDQQPFTEKPNACRTEMTETPSAILVFRRGSSSTSRSECSISLAVAVEALPSPPISAPLFLARLPPLLRAVFWCSDRINTVDAYVFYF